VNLNRDAVRPRAERVFTGDRVARFVQQRASSTRPRLGQPLSRADAPREARIHQRLRQRVRLAIRRRVGRVPESLRVGEAFFDRVERSPVKQVRRVDGVSGGPQLVGECDDAFRQSLDVMEQQYLGHGLRIRRRSLPHRRADAASED
jgi:hypothetical protein